MKNALECPKCGCPDSLVVKGRPKTLKVKTVTGKIIAQTVYIRRRQCDHCQHRWSTRER